MSPELRDLLSALEHQAEALALQAAALRQQITALVSEAEHGEVAERAEGGTPAPAFYGGEPNIKVERSDDATARPSRARRSP